LQDYSEETSYSKATEYKTTVSHLMQRQCHYYDVNFH